jgi:uroporphyrinogen decarboxylase
MNSMERVLAAVEGKPRDRCAFTAMLSLYGARLTGCDLERYYTDPAAYVRGQLAVLETFHPDILLSPLAFAAMGMAFGSKLHFFADHEPNICRPAIASADEWDRVALPDPGTHPHLLFFRETVRGMAAKTRGEVPIAAVLPSPMDFPILIMGIEEWLNTVLFDAPRARRIVDDITPLFVSMANGILKDGAAFVVLSCAFASTAIVTREIVADFSRPALEGALAQLNGPVVLHCTSAPFLRHLDLLTGLPSAAAFAVDYLDNLSDVRQAVGPGAVLLGGPSGPALPDKTAAQVEEECRAILEDRRQDAHFILCTAGTDIPLSTPPENIHAIRRAVEAQGGILGKSGQADRKTGPVPAGAVSCTDG